MGDASWFLVGALIGWPIGAIIVHVLIDRWDRKGRQWWT